MEEERLSVEEVADVGSAGEEAAEGMEEEVEHVEGGEVANAGAADSSAGTSGADIDVTRFDELRLSTDEVEGAQEAWRLLINSAASRDAVAEAIYAALFESAPSLQVLFVSPRNVQAMRFFQGINTFVLSLGTPAELKGHVESLGFQHLDKDVTVPRSVIFRDAIVDLFVVELGSKLSSAGAKGLVSLLNYVAGSVMYIRTTYAERLRILNESWSIANDKGNNADKFASMGSKEEVAEGHPDHKGGAKGAQEGAEGEKGGGSSKSDSMVQNVPTTYNEMFKFNAAVMGFGRSVWMNEVLAQFDNIITNVAFSARLQEECCVLVLRISKVTTSKINLAEYKSCMLASLRSLLPKDWTTEHEVAWSWMWENVEKMVLVNMGKPPIWEKAVVKLVDSIDEATGYQLRQDIYAKFFALCPAGESFFKQSNTYLHLVATKIIVMTVDIYLEPVRMVDDISALGLRHVGYAIPTEFFGPFVSVCVEVVQLLGAEEAAVEGFRWSLSLVAKMLTRCKDAGSTVVMKSINQNTIKSMNNALSCAPRGERANWMLIIQVGTQDISPFLWSIQSGALASASTMLKDLLTFRADRDKYYYAAEELFKRHTDIVKVLLDDAPGLLPELLDGLVWRSRITVNGYRRVNSYIKDLLMTQDGFFHKTLEWVVAAEDPKIVCHPVLVLLADLVWSRVACRSFLYRKSWFLITLVIFLTSQSVIKSVAAGQMNQSLRYATFAFRLFIYLFSMGQMVFSHTAKTCKAYRAGDTFRVGLGIKAPAYLLNWQDTGNLILMFFLIVMFCTEPMLHCMGDNGGVLFTDICPGGDKVKTFPYSVFTMLAMSLYYLLLIDLAVFNNRVSAYVLVCGRMLSELALFLVAIFAVLLTLSSALTCLEQKEPEFQNILKAFMASWEMLLAMFSTDDYLRMHDEPVILLAIYAYLVIAVVFLLNLLVAQLSCAYDAIYSDMVGYARLKRLRIITDSMPSVTPKRWSAFLNYLELDKAIEFNEGDIGLAGGVQVLEVSNANPTTVDMIKRFGGSTSPSIQWPVEESGDDDSDKFQRLEDLIKKVGEAVSKVGSTKKKKGGGASSSGMSGGGEDSGAGGEGAGEGSAEEVAEDGAAEEVAE